MPETVSTETLRFEDGRLLLLDQTRLPTEVATFECQTVEQAHDAISRLVVRGAPAIGIAAAYTNIAAVYQAQNDSEKALTYILKAYALDKEYYPQRHPRTTIYVCENLIKLQRFTEAKSYLLEGIDQARKNGDKRTEILAITMLGDMAVTQDLLDSAASSYHRHRNPTTMK